MPKQIQKSGKPPETFKVPTTRPSKSGITKKLKNKSPSQPSPLVVEPKVTNHPGEDDEESELSFSEASESTHDSGIESSDLSSSVTDELTSRGDGRQMTLDPKTTSMMQNKIATHAKKVTEIKHTDPRGSIYIGHLPWGFFENQLKKFFSQFGIVTGINMPRSKKTGNFKHYAFVEFLDPMVAKIAADTMNGYIMLSRTLDVRYIPPEQSKSWLFKKRTKPRPLDKDVYRDKANKVRTESEVKSRHIKLLKKENKTRLKLMDAGIDCWDFPGFKEDTKRRKLNPTTGPTEGTPSQTTVPGQTATDKETPTVTTTDKETPAVTTTKKETPIVTTTEKETPTVTKTKKETPTVTKTKKETPTVTKTKKETPDVTTTEKVTPTVTKTKKETPTVTKTKKETPTVTTTEKETPTTKKETPTVTTTEKETPTVTKTKKETPTVTKTKKETPTVTTTEKETPTVTTTKKETVTTTETLAVRKTTKNTPGGKPLEKKTTPVKRTQSRKKKI